MEMLAADGNKHTGSLSTLISMQTNRTDRPSEVIASADSVLYHRIDAATLVWAGVGLRIVAEPRTESTWLLGIMAFVRHTAHRHRCESFEYGTAVFEAEAAGSRGGTKQAQA